MIFSAEKGAQSEKVRKVVKSEKVCGRSGTRGQFRGKLFAHPFLLLGIRYYKLYIFICE